MVQDLATKKITKATVKSFVKTNKSQLFINLKSRFDGMTDGVEKQDAGWQNASNPSEWAQKHTEQTMGIDGAWFVGESRDRFTYHKCAEYTGIEVYNCCGSFILAIKNTVK